jgi:Tfp pilus assembly protein PilW
MKSKITNRILRIPLNPQPSTLNPGFSLVEMVIYVGLLALILVALLSSVQLMMHSWYDVHNHQLLAQSGQLALERMEREIRNATSTDASSSFGVNPGSITLNTTDASSTATTTTFSVSGGMLMLTPGVGSAVPLLETGVGVQNLTFYKITTPYSTAIRIVLQLQTATTTSPISATFYDTAVLRGSY